MKKYIAAFLALLLCISLCACQEEQTQPTDVLPQATDPIVTEGTRNSALDQAKMYLSVMNYSYQGLIQQLIDVGYSEAEAIMAVDACAANWTQQAIDSANAHVLSGSFSKGAMYHQLAYEGFTEEQILTALEGCEANWNQEAVQALQAYLQIAPFSESAMHDQLIFEDFAEEEVTYALESANVDWTEQAIKRAEQLKEEGTAVNLLAQTLVNEGYTQEQADAAASA